MIVSRLKQSFALALAAFMLLSCMAFLTEPAEAAPVAIQSNDFESSYSPWQTINTGYGLSTYNKFAGSKSWYSKADSGSGPKAYILGLGSAGGLDIQFKIKFRMDINESSVSGLMQVDTRTAANIVGFAIYWNNSATSSWVQIKNQSGWQALQQKVYNHVWMSVVVNLKAADNYQHYDLYWNGTSTKKNVVGDHTGSGQPVQMWFQDNFSGTKDAYLRMDNFKVGTGLNIAPTSNFSGTPTSGNPGLSVSFTDSSVNDPNTWNWSFGDGTYSSSQNPTHVYNNPGTYNVILNTTNEFGYDLETKNGYVTVNSLTPVINSAAPSTSITEDAPYYYNATADQAGTWNMTTSHSWLSLNTTSGKITGTPDNGDVANHTINMTFTNANGTDWLNWSLLVSNNAGHITNKITNDTEYSLATYYYDVNSTDEGTGATYSLATSFSGITINSSTGVISGYLPFMMNVTLEVTVNDGNGGTDSFDYYLIAGPPDLGLSKSIIFGIASVIMIAFAVGLMVKMVGRKR